MNKSYNFGNGYDWTELLGILNINCFYDGKPLKKEECNKYSYVCDELIKGKTLKELYPNKPISMLSEVFKVVMENKQLLPLLPVLAEPLGATEFNDFDDVTPNDLYYCNMISPLVKLLKSSRFKTEYLSIIESNQDIVCLNEVLKYETVKDVKTVLQLVRNLEVTVDNIRLFIKSMEKAGFNAENYKSACNKTRYLELLNLKYAEKFPGVVNKYGEIIPIYALSAILVMHNSGCPIDRLPLYEDVYTDSRFWDTAIGLNKVVISDTDTVLNKEQLENLINVTQILGGAYEFFRAGQNPDFNEIVELALQKEEKKVSPLSLRYGNINYDTAIYLVSCSINYGILNGNMPYYWKYFKQVLSAILQKEDMRYCKIDRSNPMEAVYYIFVNPLGGEYTKPRKETSILPISDVLAGTSISEFEKILSGMLNIGANSGIYDWYFMYTMYLLAINKFEYRGWYQLSVKNPILFTCAFFKCIIAFQLGAKDYTFLINNENNGRFMLKQLEKEVNPNYNLATACLFKLLSYGQFKFHFKCLNKDKELYKVSEVMTLMYPDNTTKVINLFDVLKNIKSVYDNISDIYRYDISISVKNDFFEMRLVET